MEPVFRKVTDFRRGTLYALLADAYSFDERCAACWASQWQEFDDFFYDNPKIADACGFVTVLEGEPIGMISWDPRNRPEYVILGHNCIVTRCKGKGFGKRQLREAVARIGRDGDVKKIVVDTNSSLVAPRNYESVGFVLCGQRDNTGEAAFSGDHLRYELGLK